MLNNYVLGYLFMAIMLFGNGCTIDGRIHNDNTIDCGIYNNNQAACQNEKNKDNSKVCNWELGSTEDACSLKVNASGICDGFLKPLSVAPDSGHRYLCISNGCVYSAGYAVVSNELLYENCIAPTCTVQNRSCYATSPIGLRNGTVNSKSPLCTFVPKGPDKCVNVAK